MNLAASSLTSKAFKVKSFYEWVEYNKGTSIILIDCKFDGVFIPPKFVDSREIALNIKSTSCRDFSINIEKDQISFISVFDGTEHLVRVPIASIKSIYERKSGIGESFQVKRPATCAQKRYPKLTVVK